MTNPPDYLTYIEREFNRSADRVEDLEDKTPEELEAYYSDLLLSEQLENDEP